MQILRHASTAVRMNSKKKFSVLHLRGVSTLELRVALLPSGQRMLGALAGDPLEKSLEAGPVIPRDSWISI